MRLVTYERLTCVGDQACTFVGSSTQELWSPFYRENPGQTGECAGEYISLLAVVLTLLQRVPTGLHAPLPASGGSSLWAGVPTVGGEPDPDAAALRKALLLVLRCALQLPVVFAWHHDWSQLRAQSGHILVIRSSISIAASMRSL